MKMDGTELDGLVEYLRGKDFCPEAADVITAMRAELADLSLQACQDGDLISELITGMSEHIHRGDRAEQRVATLEAALAAQIEVDAGVDPEKFLELVIYAAKEAREKALREAVRSLRRRKAVYLLKARKAMRSAGEVQDPDLQSQQWEKSDQMMHTAEAHDYAIADILALIEKHNAG